MKNKLKPIESAIDLWDIRLSDLHGELSDCMALLADTERARAGRLVQKKDAERFALCRGLRRRILAGYLEQDPAGLQFKQNGNGKPFLEDGGLEFNVSHSRDRMLIAVAAGRSVGVDIEFRRDDVPMDAIATRWFSAQELARFRDSETPQRLFFDLWAKKEAFVKARGKGIFHDLRTFTVPADSRTTLPGIGKNNRWVFQPLEIDPAYAAALVFEAPAVPVQIRSFASHE